MRVIKFLDSVFDFFRPHSPNREEKEQLQKLPWDCRGCELLGICRDRKNDWKYRENKCILLDGTEHEGLKVGCAKCELLTECRRPKEQGWKCYDGCLKMNRKRQKFSHFKLPKS